MLIILLKMEVTSLLFWIPQVIRFRKLATAFQTLNKLKMEL